jgi:catechol 2,3-dioxygenase-like lactoylglutathione lyase family enzyme
VKPQNPNKLFPLLVTSRLAATKHFYLEKLGFTLTFDLPTYLQVRSADEAGPELCFMSPDGFHDGTTHPEFTGHGVYMSIPAPDVDAKYQQLVAKDLKPLNEPSDKPWGWRSFQLLDPNGLVLDFFHLIEAKSM